MGVALGLLWVYEGGFGSLLGHFGMIFGLCCIYVRAWWGQRAKLFEKRFESLFFVEYDKAAKTPAENSTLWLLCGHLCGHFAHLGVTWMSLGVHSGSLWVTCGHLWVTRSSHGITLASLECDLGACRG